MTARALWNHGRRCQSIIMNPPRNQPKAAMDQPTQWRSSQYLTLMLVLAVHAGLLAWLLRALKAPLTVQASSESIQLMTLSPQTLPKIRVESLRPWRPVIGAPSFPPPLPGTAPSIPADASLKSASKDGGSGVDWQAEARRALQAFEIRSRQPANISSVSRTSAAEQPWWPAHRPGDRYKTADGNWIVWVDSSCYRIATSSPSNDDAGLPGTVCPGQADPPAADRPASPR